MSGSTHVPPRTARTAVHLSHGKRKTAPLREARAHVQMVWINASSGWGFNVTNSVVQQGVSILYRLFRAIWVVGREAKTRVPPTNYTNFGVSISFYVVDPTRSRFAYASRRFLHLFGVVVLRLSFPSARLSQSIHLTELSRKPASQRESRHQTARRQTNQTHTRKQEQRATADRKIK